MTDFNKLSDLTKALLVFALYAKGEKLPMPAEECDKYMRIYVDRKTTLLGHYPRLVIELLTKARKSSFGKVFSTYDISAYEVNYDEKSDEVFNFYDVAPDKLESVIYAYLGPEGLMDMPHISVDIDE